jgi:hypothetical protein
MSELIVLTFAEIEFLLRSRTPAIESTRELLKLPAGSDTDVVAAAGLAGLLATGRCRLQDGEIVPTGETVAVVAGLTTANCLVRAVGWVGDQTLVAYFFSGVENRIVLRQVQFGQYTVQAIGMAKPLSATLTEFVMSCLESDGPRAVLVQATTATESAGIAVAVDESGSLVMSDTLKSADRGVPTDEERIVARLVALLDHLPVVAR